MNVSFVGFGVKQTHCDRSSSYAESQHLDTQKTRPSTFNWLRWGLVELYTGNPSILLVKKSLVVTKRALLIYDIYIYCFLNGTTPENFNYGDKLQQTVAKSIICE